MVLFLFAKYTYCQVESAPFRLSAVICKSISDSTAHGQSYNIEPSGIDAERSVTRLCRHQVELTLEASHNSHGRTVASEAQLDSLGSAHENICCKMKLGGDLATSAVCDDWPHFEDLAKSRQVIVTQHQSSS